MRERDCGRAWSRWLGRIACLFACAALVGCGSATDVSEFSGARADVDQQTGTMRLPLDDYALTGAEAYAVTQANAILTDRCLARSGLSHPAANLAYESFTPVPDRSFGLWSESVARIWAYELPPSQPMELEAAYEAMPEDWWNSFYACNEEVELLPPMSPHTGDPNRPSPVDVGYTEALKQAQNDERYREAREAWASCVENQGITVEAGSLFVPVIPENEENAMRTALQDVACKQQLGTAQIVGDIFAQYQAAYIAQHEAELATYRDEAVAVLQKAREIIATR